MIRQRGRARAEDSKTVQAHRFEVPPGTEALALSFDYAPRVARAATANRERIAAAFDQHAAHRRAALDAAGRDRLWRALDLEARAQQLDNLLNVVLVDPRGRWRGRWDRNPASDRGALVLGREVASPGFTPGPIEAGAWTAAVECHGIFGDPVAYQLEVAARGRPTAGEAARLGAPRPAVADHGSADPGPAPEISDGPRWYLGEMHSHTFHSDGKHDLAELAAKVKALGGDFLALTDHNTMSGHLEPGALPVVLLAGCELTTFDGHHPIYWPTSAGRELVPWHEQGRVRALAEIAPVVRAQGGLVSVAHPFSIGDPICTGCRAPADLDPTSFDLLEVWYKQWDFAGCDNEASRALWDRLWQAGHRVTAVAARDWHGRDQDGCFPGRLPLTAVRAAERSAGAIFEGLRQGAVVMTGGPLLELVLDDGKTRPAAIGEVLRTAQAPALRARVERLDGPAELRLLRSGEQIFEQRVAGDGPLDLPRRADRPGWYRAELWRQGQPRAITNHVVWERG
ncbi:MAG: CehA/McbA family metallohydrolase [Deltaproteobacteria bacterium]|nr:CehA/McbA family metallohydrolase [Deltaproteobacteria bacterium]